MARKNTFVNARSRRRLLCCAVGFLQAAQTHEAFLQMLVRKCDNNRAGISVRLHRQPKNAPERLGLCKLQMEHKGSDLSSLQFFMGLALYTDLRSLRFDQEKTGKSPELYKYLNISLFKIGRSSLIVSQTMCISTPE